MRKFAECGVSGWKSEQAVPFAGSMSCMTVLRVTPANLVRARLQKCGAMDYSPKNAGVTEANSPRLQALV